MDFDICLYCGQKILKGALRCGRCNKILQTAQERKFLIEKFKESKKSFDIKKLIKVIIVLIAFGIIYFFFSDHIFTFIHEMLQ
jgi:uncharacterized membrane protein YvbJ